MFIMLLGLHYTMCGGYIYQPAGVTVYNVRWVYLSDIWGYSIQGALVVIISMLEVEYKDEVGLFISHLSLQYTMFGVYICQPAGLAVYKLRWVYL